MSEPKIGNRAPLLFLPLAGSGNGDVTRQQLATVLAGDKPILAFDIQGVQRRC